MMPARRLRTLAALCLAYGFCLGTSLAADKKEKKDKDVLPMRVVQASTCKEVRADGDLLAPVEPADRFLTSEKKVTSFVRFQHVIKAHKVQWKWYDPDGKLYTQSSELPVALKGKYHEFYTAAHSILVNGEKAMLQPGQWKVAIFLDGTVAASSSFNLSSKDAGP